MPASGDLNIPWIDLPYFEKLLDESTLDAGMREFVNDPRNAIVDDAARTVTLSKIFDWFAADFVGKSPKDGNSKALVDYVNRYRTDENRIPRDYKVEFSDYDKRINKQ